MREVVVGAQDVGRFLPIVGDQRLSEFRSVSESVRQRLSGRALWHVNSTAAGGGVAEMLQSLLPYVRGTNIDAHWAVIQGTPEFFQTTKRLHHSLHGSRGDGSPLGDEARAIYDATIRENAAQLSDAIRPRDVVILHDPQTAGLAPYLIEAGALVIWWCHIGCDASNAEVENGWAFLAPYLREVPAFVSARQAYVPTYCDHGKATIITPTIDAFSPKNQELDEATVRAVLVSVGLVEGPPGTGTPQFIRHDGSPGRVNRQADVIRLGRAPTADTALVLQISRWDPLKDPVGVMLGFADLVNGGAPGDAELVLAGPNVRAVADDPEGAQVLDEVIDVWRQLPHTVRNRIHIASLPMADVEENAAVVNALQRHAAVVVQKSLHEGFGLTVTEAMWKGRPILASAVGGIQDQITDGEQGLLLKDPTDRAEFGAALRRLLDNPDYARRLGAAARHRVREQFLGLHQLTKLARLINQLNGAYDAAGCPNRFAAVA